MIEFCRLANLTQFFARYRAWVAFQNLSHPHNAVAIEANSDTAIRVYQLSEKDLIIQDPCPVVAIDLREGLKEILLLQDYLPDDKHYIIFSGSKPGPDCRLDNDRYTMIYYDALLADMIDLHLSSQSPYFYNCRDYKFDYPKPMNFVSFAGVARGHRVEFANWLPELTQQNFIYRMNMKDYGVSADHVDIVDFSKVSGDLAQWFESTAKNTPIPHYHVLGRIPDAMMNLAYFNLVLESDFDFPVFYTTEKTARPLLLGMPFVLASGRGHLGYLHDLGFKTYGELWDESYDQESNNQVRLRKVFELCQHLEQFDWAANQQRLQEIGQHNRANFINLGSHIDREFQEFERIIKEYERRH